MKTIKKFFKSDLFYSIFAWFVTGAMVAAFFSNPPTWVLVLSVVFFFLVHLVWIGKVTNENDK